MNNFSFMENAENLAQAPIHPDNIPEEEKIVNTSEPFSEERAKLLLDNLNLHQEECLKRIKDLDSEIETKRQDYWKMEGVKSILNLFFEE